MYVYTYITIYVHSTYILICTHVLDTCMYMYIYTYIYVYVHTCIQYVCTCTYVYIYIYIYICIYIHTTYVHTYYIHKYIHPVLTILCNFCVTFKKEKL